MKFPTYKELGEKVAEEAMDTFEYNGKTLREWIEIIASNDGDTISRKAAIKALNSVTHKHCITDFDAVSVILDLPSAEPSRTPMQELLDVTADRDYWKAQCHSYEMTINRLTESAQPETTRCKDCKYWHSGSCECPEYIVFCQDYMVGDIETEAEHYCGYAERREVTT